MQNNNNYDYECALSGLTQSGIEEASVDSDDDLFDMPVGWTKVTFQRREYNPKWLMIQEMKQMVIQGMMTQVPEEMQRAQGWLFGLQAEAQFHSLEKDTPMFITVEDVAYVSDHGEVKEELAEMKDVLGLTSEEDEEDDEDLADESHLPHDGEVGDDDDDDDEDDEDDE